MPKVSSQILLWARETSGISENEAVRRLGLKDTKTASGLQKLAELETGVRNPSRSLLTKIAKVYRRPLVTFYLSSPPIKGVRGQDFRSVTAGISAEDDGLVDTLVRDLRARQDIVREALESMDEAESHEYVGSIKLSDGTAAGLGALTKLLGVDRQVLKSAATPEESFKRLRQRASTAGTYVILQGDLGSHHSDISADTFRGFALADRTAPFVVINDNDSPTAWSFTLLHELVHLCLGATGISGGPSETAIEQFCNDVASAYLVDEGSLRALKITDSTEVEAARSAIGNFAAAHHVSRSMAAYRLYRAGKISHSYWMPLHNYFRAQWLDSRSRNRERNSDSGPNYYVVRRHRIGEALLGAVRRMITSGTVSTTKAAKILSVKPQNVGTLVNMSTPISSSSGP